MHYPLQSRENRPKRRGNAQAALTPVRAQHELMGRRLAEEDMPPGLRADAVAHLQRLSGNAAVQRYLTGGSTALQREKAKGEAETAAQSGEGVSGFDLDRWLSGKVYDLVKGQLGEAKLKGYAKELARKAADLLLAQMGEVNSEDDMVQKAQRKIMGDLFTQEVGKATADILESPAGKRVQELILAEARERPGAVIGAVLTALAYMAATNADIPKIELEKKLGKGWSVQGAANLGKFQDLALKQIKAGIAYSGQGFQASLSGSYTGEKPKGKLSMAEEVSLTSQEKKLKTDSTLTSAGDLTLDLSLKSLGLKTNLVYGGPSKWMGVWEFRLGEKSHYWAPRLILGPDQKLTFALGHRFTKDAVTLQSMLKPAEASMAHYLKLDKPFGAQGLSVEASLEYRLDEPKITGAKFAGQYKLLEGKPDRPFPVIVLKVEGQYGAGTAEKPGPNLSGLIVLAGVW